MPILQEEYQFEPMFYCLGSNDPSTKLAEEHACTCVF